MVMALEGLGVHLVSVLLHRRVPVKCRGEVSCFQRGFTLDSLSRQTQDQLVDAPAPYKTAGILMLAAGAVNLVQSALLAFVIFSYATMTALATFGLGIVCYACMIWPIIPFVMGIIELIMGIRAMSGQRVQGIRTVSTVGIVAAALNLSMIPLVLEIIAMVQLGDAQVVGYLEEGVY